MACDRRETVSPSLRRSHACPRCLAETARAMTVCGLVYQGYPRPAATTKRCLWSMQQTSRMMRSGRMPKIHGVGPGADPLHCPRRQGAPNNRSLVGPAGGDQYCTADHWQRYRRSGVASIRGEKHCCEGDSGQPGESQSLWRARTSQPCDGWRQDRDERSQGQLPAPCQRREVCASLIDRGLDRRPDQRGAMIKDSASGERFAMLRSAREEN